MFVQSLWELHALFYVSPWFTQSLLFGATSLRRFRSFTSEIHFASELHFGDSFRFGASLRRFTSLWSFTSELSAEKLPFSASIGFPCLCVNIKGPLPPTQCPPVAIIFLHPCFKRCQLAGVDPEFSGGGGGGGANGRQGGGCEREHRSFCHGIICYCLH